MNNKAQSAILWPSLVVKARLARDLVTGPPAGRLKLLNIHKILPVSVIYIHGSVVNNIHGGREKSCVKASEGEEGSEVIQGP